MFDFHLYQITVLLFWAVGLVVLYWAIRLAVRHAIGDADKRRKARDFDAPSGTQPR